MRDLLRPGGIGYHVYNPFFSANGGHSLCTLDFPWGHVRLDALDFERYLEEIRPADAAQTLRFYRESLNRMTFVDLRATVAAAGLDLVALLPWLDRGLVGQLVGRRDRRGPAHVSDGRVRGSSRDLRGRRRPAARMNEVGQGASADETRAPVDVRPAIMDDARLLFDWANDPATRAASFRVDAIAWPEHLRWLADRLASPTVRVMIGLEGATPVGQVRFEQDAGGTAEISVSVDAGSRGRGLGVALVLAGIDAIRADRRVRRATLRGTDTAGQPVIDAPVRSGGVPSPRRCPVRRDPVRRVRAGGMTGGRGGGSR